MNYTVLIRESERYHPVGVYSKYPYRKGTQTIRKNMYQKRKSNGGGIS